MKIDLGELFVSVMSMAIVKFLLVCILCTVGGALPIIIQLIHGGPIHENYIHLGGSIFLFFPFYVCTVASVTGWWTFISGPLAMVMIYRLYRYLKDDVSHFELVNLFTLSYLCTLIVVNPHWITGILLALCLIGACRFIRKYNQPDADPL